MIWFAHEVGAGDLGFSSSFVRWFAVPVIYPVALVEIKMRGLKI